ncbi:hypothetical protein [Stenotrophomonas sp.]|uniref:hypothetical protein n=1 Tax=Stenotrophomonas sp. TaxID=69392 RepID=UPI0028A89012|nr:hypothetical protein [Stenotrophomonas sp.]
MFSAEDERLHAQGVQVIARCVIPGRKSRDAMLQLLDGAGQPRLQLQVTPKGEATLSFLDEHGDAVRVISAEQL